jgi:hypothetical protein
MGRLRVMGTMGKGTEGSEDEKKRKNFNFAI